ncbi:uncharacterized protein LOC141725095 [Apium graveolens]|uniref:uncharacterized protein LOC141725095 n=1 Tax=Apium graveolens TaxID=4045 RepID=UPI003D7AA2F1
MLLQTKNVCVLALTLLLLFPVSSAATSPTSPAKIVNGVVSNAVSVLLKWLLSLKASTKTAISNRPMMKFESGYTVETVFDGSILGIEPYSVEVLSSGELLVLDSANSNLYKVSSSLSQFTRPKLVAGSAEGYSGHIDGKLREARMNHPKGLTVDHKGNIYVADTVNTAIRKISDAGITTIAGGKWGKGGVHVDGPSEDARFSNDFDVVYIGSSCSLLVIDRGYKAIREIQLPFDDCANQYESGFPLGIAVLIAAGFFGYMLALLQRRIGSIVSSESDQGTAETRHTSSPYQTPLISSVRPPLIPNEDEQERQEGFIGSLGKLLSSTGASAVEILGGIFPGLRKKHHEYQFPDQQEYLQEHKYSNTWPVQDSFVIREEDEPPSTEARTPTPRKTYPFMSQDIEKMEQFRQSRKFYSSWDDKLQQQRQPEQTHRPQQHQHQHRQFSSTPETYYEQSREKTNEIVFGAVQEQGKQHKSVVIKPLDYRSGTRSRVNSRGDPPPS